MCRKIDILREKDRSVFKTKELRSSPAVVFVTNIIYFYLQSQRKDKFWINCSIKDQSCVCWAAREESFLFVDKSSLYLLGFTGGESVPVILPCKPACFCRLAVFFCPSLSKQHFLFSHLHFIFLLYCSLHDWCLNFKTCTGDRLYVNIHTALTNQ